MKRTRHPPADLSDADEISGLGGLALAHQHILHHPAGMLVALLQYTHGRGRCTNESDMLQQVRSLIKGAQVKRPRLLSVILEGHVLCARRAERTTHGRHGKWLLCLWLIEHQLKGPWERATNHCKACLADWLPSAIGAPEDLN